MKNLDSNLGFIMVVRYHIISIYKHIFKKPSLFNTFIYSLVTYINHIPIHPSEGALIRRFNKNKIENKNEMLVEN